MNFRTLGRLRRDEAGGLEGLPLYMIILVTITAVALIAILLLIPKPIVLQNMTIDPATLCFDQSADVTITVYSTTSTPVNDVTVTLQGENVSKADKTAGGGTVTMTVTPHTNDANQQLGSIDVVATFGNNRITSDIPVTRC